MLLDAGHDHFNTSRDVLTEGISCAEPIPQRRHTAVTLVIVHRHLDIRSHTTTVVSRDLGGVSTDADEAARGSRAGLNPFAGDDERCSRYRATARQMPHLRR
jgi:hypothetical protein